MREMKEVGVIEARAEPDGFLHAYWVNKAGRVKLATLAASALDQPEVLRAWEALLVKMVTKAVGEALGLPVGKVVHVNPAEMN